MTAVENVTVLVSAAKAVTRLLQGESKAYQPRKHTVMSYARQNRIAKRRRNGRKK